MIVLTDFEVNVPRILVAEKEIAVLQRKISNVSDEVGWVLRATREAISARICAAIARSYLCGNINNCSKDMARLRDGLSYAACQYRLHEDRIADKQFSHLSSILRGLGLLGILKPRPLPFTFRFIDRLFRLLHLPRPVFFPRLVLRPAIIAPVFWRYIIRRKPVIINFPVFRRLLPVIVLRDINRYHPRIVYSVVRNVVGAGAVRVSVGKVYKVVGPLR